MTETEKGFGLGKPYTKLEVIGTDGIKYTSVECRSIEEAHQALMNNLNALTSGQGVRLPNDVLVQGEIGRKIGIFRFGVQRLDSRPLTT